MKRESGSLRLTTPAPTGTVADIPDEELLRRAVKGARATRRGLWPRWVAVMDAFCLGSTFAAELCRRFDLDPNEQVRR